MPVITRMAVAAKSDGHYFSAQRACEFRLPMLRVSVITVIQMANSLKPQLVAVDQPVHVGMLDWRRHEINHQALRCALQVLDNQVETFNALWQTLIVKMCTIARTRAGRYFVPYRKKPEAGLQRSSVAHLPLLWIKALLDQAVTADDWAVGNAIQ